MFGHFATLWNKGLIVPTTKKSMFMLFLSAWVLLEGAFSLLVSLSIYKYFKVARVFNIRLRFTELLFCNLIILIKWCKIQYLSLDEALLFPRNQVTCLKNLKLWWAPTTIELNIFCWNFAHASVLSMSTIGCLGFFLFCLDLDLLINLVSVRV